MKKRKKSNLKRKLREEKMKKLREKLTRTSVVNVIYNMIGMTEKDLGISFNEDEKELLVTAMYSEYSTLNKDVGQIRTEHDLYRVMKSAYERLDSTISGIVFDDGAKITCSKGCSYCCHQYISVSVPSLLMVARNIDKSCLKDIDQFMDYESPCMFLKDHKCEIYPDRPFPCRWYFSVRPSSLCEETYIQLKPNMKYNMPAIVVAHGHVTDAITDFVFDSYGYQRIYTQNMIQLIKDYFNDDSFMKKWLNKEWMDYGSDIKRIQAE